MVCLHFTIYPTWYTASFLCCFPWNTSLINSFNANANAFNYLLYKLCIFLYTHKENLIIEINIGQTSFSLMLLLRGWKWKKILPLTKIFTSFLPSKNILFEWFQKHVKIYNLVKSRLLNFHLINIDLSHNGIKIYVCFYLTKHQCPQNGSYSWSS